MSNGSTRAGSGRGNADSEGVDIESMQQFLTKEDVRFFSGLIGTLLVQIAVKTGYAGIARGQERLVKLIFDKIDKTKPSTEDLETCRGFLDQFFAPTLSRYALLLLQEKSPQITGNEGSPFKDLKTSDSASISAKVCILCSALLNGKLDGNGDLADFVISEVKGLVHEGKALVPLHLLSKQLDQLFTIATPKFVIDGETISTPGIVSSSSLPADVIVSSSIIDPKAH